MAEDSGRSLVAYVKSVDPLNIYVLTWPFMIHHTVGSIEEFSTKVAYGYRI